MRYLRGERCGLPASYPSDQVVNSLSTSLTGGNVRTDSSELRSPWLIRAIPQPPWSRHFPLASAHVYFLHHLQWMFIATIPILSNFWFAPYDYVQAFKSPLSPFPFIAAFPPMLNFGPDLLPFLFYPRELGSGKRSEVRRGWKRANVMSEMELEQ